MTNEQKAKELAEKHEDAQMFGVCSPYHAALGAALEMGEWKQQQMIERFMMWIADLHRRNVIRNFHTGDSYTEKDMIHDIKQFLMEEMEEKIREEEIFQQAQYTSMVIGQMKLEQQNMEE